jgi:hypothetical protein
MTMRDLQKDLELCQKATPGPWIALPEACGPDGMEVYQEESMGCICIAGDPHPRGENRPTANMHFIAAAREGWPHAIDRALKAEAGVEKLRAEVERLRRREETILRWLDDSCCPPRMLGSRCPERACGECFREALDIEEAREREEDGGRDSA